eukprot:5280432-Amphidinium_carterae.1
MPALWIVLRFSTGRSAQLLQWLDCWLAVEQPKVPVALLLGWHHRLFAWHKLPPFTFVEQLLESDE